MSNDRKDINIIKLLRQYIYISRRARRKRKREQTESVSMMKNKREPLNEFKDLFFNRPTVMYINTKFFFLLLIHLLFSCCLRHFFIALFFSVLLLFNCQPAEVKGTQHSQQRVYSRDDESKDSSMGTQTRILRMSIK